MLILLSCAKTMCEKCEAKPPVITRPLFLEEARRCAAELSGISVEDLARLLHVPPHTALDNQLRYREFQRSDKQGIPALLAYTGVVFKHIAPDKFSDDDFLFAQDHLRITSFLYGLLRPLDGILPYRLEGNVRLSENDDKSMFEFWRSRLTDTLISDTKAAGSTLCNLASAEMRNLFDWKRVEKETRVITPEFRVNKEGRLKTIVIYAKMMRGEMTRFILKNRISNPDELKHFESVEGFSYSPEHSTAERPLFFV